MMTLRGACYHRPPGLPGVEILSCPDQEADFPPHLHDTLTLWINDQGGEYLRYRGSKSILQPDSFGLINAGEVHANGYAGGNGRHLRSIYIDDGVVEKMLDSGKRSTHWPDGLHCASGLHQALGRLHQTLLISPSPLECAQAMAETLNLLGGFFRTKKDPPAGAESRRTALIRSMLRDNLDRRILLDDLASAADCTPAHLIRMFRKETGLSPHAYLIRLRVAKAKRLLGCGHAPLETALATGFADQAHLSHWFKVLVGVTPGVYRRTMAGSFSSRHSSSFSATFILNKE